MDAGCMSLRMTFALEEAKSQASASQAATVAVLRGVGAEVVGHCGGPLDGAAIFQLGRNAGGAEAVVANIRSDVPD